MFMADRTEQNPQNVGKSRIFVYIMLNSFVACLMILENH